MKTKIILTADDYGIVPQINKAIIDLINKGVINATEIIPNYGEYGAKSVANTYELLEQTADCEYDFELGAHLTITSGKPLKLTDGLKKIVNSKGNFNTYRELTSDADADAIKDELKRQIDLLVDDPKIGPKITHITNHHDALWFFPEYTEKLIELSNDYNLPVRNPVSIPTKSTWIYYIAQNIVRDIPKKDKKKIKKTYKLRQDGFFPNAEKRYKTTDYMDSRHYSAGHLAFDVNPEDTKGILKKKKKTLKEMFGEASTYTSVNGEERIVEFMFHVRKGKVLDSITKEDELSFYTGINPKYFDGRTMEYRSLNTHRDKIQEYFASEFEKGSWKECGFKTLKKKDIDF